MQTRKVDGPRIGWRIDVGPWSLGDPREKDDLISHACRRGIEDRLHLEAIPDRSYIAWREKWTVPDAAGEILRHALLLT